MTHFIEAGRRNLREQEPIQADAREIFGTAIDLLRDKGTYQREYVVFKHKSIQHTINSAEPPVNFFVQAGANLEKAKTVWLKVGGIQCWLRIRKLGQGDTEWFEAKQGRNRNGYLFNPNLEFVEGYKDSLKFVEQELLPLPETE